MRILYICHLYPEFEESLTKGIWTPKGAPEISQMIQRLESSPNLQPSFILTHTNPHSQLKLKEDRLFKVKGFDTRFFALAGTDGALGMVNKILGSSPAKRMLKVIMETCKQIRPDLIYCDTENIEAASMLAENTDIPVIWRLNRMTKKMQQDPKATGRDYRKLLRSPFHRIITTLDGSGSEEWLLKHLSDETKIILMPNGYDRSLERKSAKLPENDKTRVLFAGPVDYESGWRHFVKAFTHIRDEEQTKIEALVLHEGPELDHMKEFVHQSGVDEYFQFLPPLSPEQTKDVFLEADVCVSLNLEGNLKDPVVMALCEGLCVVIPEPDTATGIDIDTDTFLPNDAALRFGDRTNTQNLANTIMEMRRIYKRRESFGKNGQKFADKKIQTWQARIDDELKIFEKIIEEQDLKKSA